MRRGTGISAESDDKLMMAPRLLRVLLARWNKDDVKMSLIIIFTMTIMMMIIMIKIIL